MSARLVALLLSGAALLATSLPAAAIEPEDAADALVAAMTAGTRAKATYAEATAQGSDVLIKGLTITHPPKGAADKAAAATPDASGDADADGDGDADAADAPAGGDTVTFAETTIQAPTEGDEGIFDSPLITFTGGAIASEVAGSIGKATLTDVTVLDPKEVNGDGPGKGVLFGTAEATDLSFKPKELPAPVTIGRIHMETSDVVDHVPQTNKGSVEAITLAPELFTGAQFTPQTLGYDKLVLGATWDGTQDKATKTVTIRDFTLNIADGGSLKVVGKLGNLPEPNAVDDPDARSKAGSVELHTLTLRYDDNSLTGRVLDFFGKQQNMAGADYGRELANGLPFLLATVITNEAFRGQLASALSTFLNDPKSLTVKFEPEAPISGADISSIMRSAPQTLPDRLKTSITANTAQ